MSGSYLTRNRTLNQLGYSSYEEYLSSDLWAEIRRRAFKMKGDDCRLCDGKASQIHHIGYGRAVLLGENLLPLVPLCRTCHYKVEFDTKHGKRSVSEAQGAFMRLAKRYRTSLFRTPEGIQTLINKLGMTPQKIAKILKAIQKKADRPTRHTRSNRR